MIEPPVSLGDIPERLGDFRLLERLGAGGMDVVYRARQESLQRDVALKLILPEHLWFIEARERFRREVEAAARLRHPGIVPVYTVGDQNGLPHFAMELVEGASLAAVIEHVRERRASELSGADLRAAVEARARRFGQHSTTSTLADSFSGTWVQVCCHLVLQVADALQGDHEPLSALNPAVPWDTATVCASAMERDPARRYATVGDFARDLRNLLELRPIEARRASRTLRARRWVQRHPTASVAAVLGFLLLFVAPSVALWRIREERDVALRELRTKEGMLALVLNILGGADNSRGNPGERTVFEVVDAAVQPIRDGFRQDPGARADLLRHLAAIQGQLCRPQQAVELARESIESGTRAWGERSASVAKAKRVLASYLQSLASWRKPVGCTRK